MKLLNLGCGHRFHKDWINLDIVSHSTYVQQYDFSEKIPFPDNTMDLVYHSHVLEHLEKKNAYHFLKECFRVLKTGGILRVVVPDLEGIILEYIHNLNELRKGNLEFKGRYNWILIELFDQIQRNSPGGQMLEYWSMKNIPNKEYIISRMGEEAKNSMSELENTNLTIKVNERRKLNWREKIVQFLGFDLNHFEIGKFRKSGEVHNWMYDSFSLESILIDTNFQKIKKQTAIESYFPEFSNYSLDTNEKGEIRKPDSLYMEALKP